MASLLGIKEQEVQVSDTAMDGQFTLSARSLLSTFGIVQKQTECLKFLKNWVQAWMNQLNKKD